MLTALYENKLIYPWNYSEIFLKNASEDGKLTCPDCQKTLIFKECSNKQSHFSHLHSDCSRPFSEPESIEHESGKMLIYEWLQNQFGAQNCKIERRIQETNQEADTFVESLHLAVEFQCSPIQKETWFSRVELYLEAQIPNLWILGYSMHRYCHSDDLVSHNLNQLESAILNQYGFILYYDVLTKQFVLLNPIKKYSNTVIGMEYFYTNNEVSIKNLKFKFKDEYFFNLQNKRRMYVQKQQERAKKADVLLKDIKKTAIIPKHPDSLATKKQINYIKFLLYQKNITIPYKLHGLKKGEANSIIQELISENNKK